MANRPARMQDATREPWLTAARALAFAGLAVLIASLSVFKMSNNDIWIHLKTGEIIVRTWEVPDKDPYSFTASDHDYVAHEWLSGVLFHLVYSAGGVNALIFFKSAIVFATCAVLIGVCRLLRAGGTAMFACFTLMLFIGSARFLERPHIFSYLFEALYLLCYFAYREGGRRRAWLCAIPALHVLWTNLHGGHFQGLALLLVLAAAEVMMFLRAHRVRICLPLACVAALGLLLYGTVGDRIFAQASQWLSIAGVLMLLAAAAEALTYLVTPRFRWAILTLVILGCAGAAAAFLGRTLAAGAILSLMAIAEVCLWYLRTRPRGLAAGDALAFPEVLLVCALAPASALAALINPYGHRLLTFPFELTGQEIFMKGIYEWQSALFPTYNLSSMFLYYIVWTAILFGSFLAVRGHSELRGFREAAWALNVLLAGLWIAFVYQFASVYKNRSIPSPVEKHALFWYAVVALFLLANLHRLEFHHAGIVALFFALSMRHNRAVTDASVATLPTLAWNLRHVLDRARRAFGAPPAWLRPAALGLAGAAMLALGLFTFYDAYYFGFAPSAKREMGLGIASNMPVGAVDYIERNRITGNCFPSYNAAAVLIHRMWPEVKVAMDSRNDVYGEGLYREYIAALAGGSSLDSYLRKWPVDFFLITYGRDRAQPFFRHLDDSPDWTLVYFDDGAVVYLKNIPRFREIITRDGYALISPAQSGSVDIRAEDAPRWLAEAKRAVAAAPGAWSPLQYKSKALIVLNRLEEAASATEMILRINPGYYFAWADLGFIHTLRKAPGPAAAALKRCLELRPDYRPCRDLLDRLPGGRS